MCDCVHFLACTIRPQMCVCMDWLFVLNVVCVRLRVVLPVCVCAGSGGCGARLLPGWRVLCGALAWCSAVCQLAGDGCRLVLALGKLNSCQVWFSTAGDVMR